MAVPFAFAGFWIPIIVLVVLVFIALTSLFFGGRWGRLIRRRPVGGERRGRPGVGEERDEQSESERRRPPSTRGTKP